MQIILPIAVSVVYSVTYRFRDDFYIPLQENKFSLYTCHSIVIQFFSKYYPPRIKSPSFPVSPSNTVQPLTYPLKKIGNKYKRKIRNRDGKSLKIPNWMHKPSLINKPPFPINHETKQAFIFRNSMER